MIHILKICKAGLLTPFQEIGFTIAQFAVTLPTKSLSWAGAGTSDSLQSW